MSFKPEDARSAIEYLADLAVELAFSILQMAAEDLTHRQVAMQRHGRDRHIEQSPVLLNELNTAILNLQSVVKSGKKMSVSIWIDCIDEILSWAHKITEAHSRDHPLSQGKTFAIKSGIKRAPREDNLQWANRLVVSNERILACAMKISQSEANNQSRENSDAGLLKRTRVKNFLFPQTGEGIITLSDAGVEYCRRKYGHRRTRPCRYILSKGEHYHHLFTNYIAFTLRCFEVVATYYGFGAKEHTIRTWHKGKKEIKPDLVGWWDGELVPVEAETALRKNDARIKAEQYVDSAEPKVVVVCRDKKTAEAYYHFLMEEGKAFDYDKPTKTLFVIYFLTPVRGHMHQAVTYVGSVNLGCWPTYPSGESG